MDPDFSLDSLSCAILAPSEYLHSSQSRSSPWGPTPKAWASAASLYLVRRACKPLLGWEVLFGIDSCGEFSPLYHLITCCCLPLWGSEAPCWPRPWSACAPSLGHRSLSWNALSLFKIFLFCPTSFWGDWLAFLEIWGLLAVFWRCSKGAVPQCRWVFDVFVVRVGEVNSLSYSSAILKDCPIVLLSIIYFTNTITYRFFFSCIKSLLPYVYFFI